MTDAEILKQIIDSEHITRSDLSVLLKASVQYIGQVINGKKNLSKEKKSILKTYYPSYILTCDKIELPDKITGKTIIEIRSKLNYTQGELAKLLGVSRSAINKYESGNRNVSFATATKLKQLVEKETDKSIVYNIFYAPEVKLSKDYQRNMVFIKRVKIDSLLIGDINQDNVVILTIGDDSLSPSYEPNDKVLFDTSINTFFDGGIFVFDYNNVRYIRRISILPNKIKCIPLNEKLDTFYLMERDRYEIIGIVLTRFRL